MGFLTIVNVFRGLSALASVFSGISAIKSADKQSDALERQADAIREDANLARFEAEREADRIKKVRRAELGSSSMRFIKGGVTLQGSPLFVLKTQEELDQEEEAAVRKRGEAQRRLGFQRASVTEDRADIVENQGRAAFVGSLGQAAGTLSKIFL
jgi:hypothetical protein